MNSNLARQAEQELLEAAQHLTPEERLNAFLGHSRLMTKLYEAGIAYHQRTLPFPHKPQ